MDNYSRQVVEVGLKIAYYRKRAGLTQEELAERIGCSSGYLSQVESRGQIQAISLRTLFSIADACEIAPYKLLEFG